MIQIKEAKRLESVSTYYFAKKLAEIARLNTENEVQIINLGIGSPDLLPPKEVINTLHEASQMVDANKYQSYRGIAELRNAFAEWYNRFFNVEINAANQVLPLVGSKEGIMHISMAFLNPGDEVLIPNPGYPTYTSVSKLVGAEPKYYNLTEAGEWFPDLDAIEERDLSNVKIMWINYPHMPTGSKITEVQFEKLVTFTKRNDILLVNDNPYSFILNDRPTSLLSVKGAKEVALELNSLSKTFNMAGWRVGMVLGSSDHINAILKVKSNMDSGMFYGIQRGAIEALNIGQEWYEMLNEVYRKRRDLIFNLADTLGCTYDKEAVGLFVWAKLPLGSKSAEEFIDKILYEKNIFITPGTIFGSNGEGYIRFSLCVTEDKIQEAIDRF